MPDPEEYYCQMCDCTFEVKVVEERETLDVEYCPYCGEPLDADEL